MAYGEKYNFSFNDDKAVTWRIGISKDAYAGASTELATATGNPLTIAWKGGDMFEPMRSSEAIIQFYSITNFQFTEFFTAKETDYIVEIKRAGVIFWQGIYVSEIYNEPYIDIPYPVTLRFSDGLGYLKFIRYVNAAFTPNIIDIFRACLNLLPFSLKIREIINIIENDFTDIATNGFLNKTFLNNSFLEFDKTTQTFNKMFCYEVISNLLTSIGAYICQEDNIWKIIRIEELEKPTPNQITYLANSTVIDTTGTVSIRKTIENDLVNPSWILQDQEMNISEVFNEIIYRYEFARPDIVANQLITDHGMEIGNGTSKRYDLWKMGASIAQPSDLGKDTIDPFFNFPPPVSYISFPEGAVLQYTNTLVTGYSIKALEVDNTSTVTFSKLLAATIDTMTLTLHGVYNLYSLTVSTPSVFFYDIKVHFSIQWGTYFLKEDSNGVLSWTTVSTDTISLKVGRFLKERFISFTNGPEDHYWIEYLESITTPVFPVTAVNDLQITCYAPENPVVVFPWVTFKCREFYIFNMDCVFNPDNKSLLNFEQKIYTATGIRKKKKEIVVKFGDNISAFIRSAFRTNDLAAATLSNLWYRRGTPGTTFKSSEIFIHQPYVKYFTTYRQQLRGTIYASDLKFTNSLLTKFGELFMISSMTYDVKRSDYQVELEQINYTAPTITTIDSLALIEKTKFADNTNPTPSDTYDWHNPPNTPLKVIAENTSITPVSSFIKKTFSKTTNDDTFVNYPKV